MKNVVKMKNYDKIEQKMDRRDTQRNRTRNTRSARTLKNFTKLDDQFADEMLSRRGC